MRCGRFLLLLLLGAAAAEGPDARDVFRRAVEAQGGLKREEIRDVKVEFEGEIAEEGRPHTVRRTYWYRSKDRSFRLRTGSMAAEKLLTDRGVLGGDYWELSSDGGVVRLSPVNRDDLESIRTIDQDRAAFERMLGMVLLTRLDGDGWRIAFGESGPKPLLRDEPFESRRTLRDREKETYHVLDATREGEPRLRLFVHAGDFTVRKAVEYDAGSPDAVRWVYYFAFAERRRDPPPNPLLPVYFSVYRDTPTDKRSRAQLLEARGEPRVFLNSGLLDRDMLPAPTK